MTVATGSHMPGLRAKPFIVRDVRPLGVPEHLAARRLKVRPHTADEANLLIALAARPEGPDLSDAQGRRLIPNRSNANYFERLRATGKIELVQISCVCGRAHPICDCAVLAWRLIKEPTTKRVVIDAAHRFRKAG